MNSHNIKQILLVFLITMFLGVQTFAATQTSVDATGNVIQQAPVPVTPAPVEEPEDPIIAVDPNAVPNQPVLIEEPEDPIIAVDPNAAPNQPVLVDPPVIINNPNNGGNTGGNPGGGNGNNNGRTINTQTPSNTRATASDNGNNNAP